MRLPQKKSNSCTPSIGVVMTDIIPTREPSLARWRGTSFLLLIILLSGPCDMKPAFAQIDPNQAIKAIVGEAENQGFLGMQAVAEAIRNRGTLDGVYGLKSSRLKKAPKWVFMQAEKAWEASESSNLVKGATHWENIKAFGVPYWAKSMKKTATVKDHAFYRVMP